MNVSFKSPLNVVEIKNLAGKTYIYQEIKSSIREKNGDSIFEKVVYTPVNWSQTASDILSQKYMRKKGIPLQSKTVEEANVYAEFRRSEPVDNPEIPYEEQFTGENSAHQVFHRLAGCWTYWGIKSGYFVNKKNAIDFYADCYDALYKQIAAPNSPQFFNTGLNWAYGIKTNVSTEPLYHNDISTGLPVKSTEGYVHPAVHACFINSVRDNLVGKDGIYDLVLKEATIFKYGSGSGANYSNIRGVGETLSGGGVSSGLMSFLRINDVSAGAIKSGGTTRRSARLVVVDADHPEIEDFVSWKVKEENKVAALVSGSILNKKLVSDIVNAESQESFELAITKAHEANLPSGMLQRAILAYEQEIPLDLETFDNDWQGEAYTTISGQNANNSVSVTDNFLDSVKSDADWNLIGRKSKKPVKTIKAKKLWDDITFAAWASADPGLFYYDNINHWNTVANDGAIVSANPCIEFQFLNNTACNLASLNLVAIYKEANEDIDLFIELLKKYSVIFTTVLDISIQMAQLPSEEMAANTWKYRPLGLGYGNIGSLLMRWGIPYGKDDSTHIVRFITAIMHGTALLQSAKLASKLGAFPRFEENKEPFFKVMQQHHDKVSACIDNHKKFEANVYKLYKAAGNIWDSVLKEKSFRNAYVTNLVPMGTTGLVLDCDTTGIEPDFSLVKHKKLAGGGYIKLVNQAVPEALRYLGYNNLEIEEICGHISGFGKFPEFNTINDRREICYITKSDLINSGVKEKHLQEINYQQHFSLLSIIEELEKISGADLSLFKTPSENHINTEKYIFGYGCIDDCTIIDPEDLPIFDCAVPGKVGGRFLDTDAHLNIMAAAQEFLSGAISKTVNLPYNATVKDISDVYFKAHKLGIKAVSVYRDGSKLSQPLMSSVSEYITQLVNKYKDKKEPEVSPDVVKQHIVNIFNEGSRRKLPNKRSGYTQKVSVAGHTVYLRTGEYQDGSLGEIFLDMHKQGATFRAFMNSFAVAVSIGLQYGVPLEEFVKSFHKTKFEPAGPVVGHDNIKFTSSIIDLIFRDLAFNYLGRDDLVNVKPIKEEIAEDVFQGKQATIKVTQNVTDNTVDIKHSLLPHNSNGKIPVADKRSVYTGDICTECGSDKMVPSGTCATCQDCGATTGC